MKEEREKNTSATRSTVGKTLQRAAMTDVWVRDAGQWMWLLFQKQHRIINQTFHDIGRTDKIT